MSNHLLRYGVEMATDLGFMSFFLLCVRYADRNPYARLFRAIPLSLAWMFGSIALITLLQALIPSLDTSLYVTLGILVSLGFGVFSVIYFLCGARYVENTSALLVLLFFLCIVLVKTGMVALAIHHSPPPPLLAFATALLAIGGLALVPCWWFERWLRARLDSLLPRPAFFSLQSARRNTSRSLRFTLIVSVLGGATSLVMLAWLFQLRQIGLFVAALPWAGGVLAGWYLLDTAIYWGLRALFLRRPLFARLVSAASTIAPESFDEQ